MNDWSAGYVADLDYTYGYYDELNPLRMQLPFIKSGLAYPEIKTACELGFGQGLSTNLHAAASAVEWYGTDFNPTQVGFARELAENSGADTHLFDQDFDEFCRRSDLPDFDFIALHGVWSWISDENRATIVDFINRKLKVGGVVYISYNTSPAWSAFAPLRNLLVEHARVMSAQGLPLAVRIKDAMKFVQQLIDSDAAFFKAHPVIIERMKKMATQAPHYIAHEFFNQNWDPMDFSTVANWLEPAKLSFACSASPYEHVDALCMKAVQREIVNNIPDPGFKQTTRDLLVNQQFRRDYWVKGPRTLSSLQQAEILNEQRLVLTRSAEDIDLKIKASVGEATLSEAIYQPIIDALAEHKAVSVKELAQRLEDKEINLSKLMEALIVCAGAGYTSPAQTDSQIKGARKACANINTFLSESAVTNNDVNHLASPVTGGGVAVDRFERIFLMARKQGFKTPAKWADFCWKLVSSQGQLVVKDGKTLQTPEENIAEYTDKAKLFKEQKLPQLIALGVA
jgi:SAM-dependent methyltransferase/RNA-binding protein YhbY